MRRYVTARIIVAANYDYPRMTPACLHDEIVQRLEISVVARQHHAVLTNRMRQMVWVIGAGHSGIAGDLHVVAGLTQEPHK